MADNVMRALSLGAGVQSSTVAMMMAGGELPPVEVAIFADTGAEPQRVYEWLAWLSVPGRLPFPVVTVMQGDGLTRNLETASSRAHCSNPPFFVRGGGTLKRNCTRDYKIAPIARELQRRRAGRRVVQVFGISFEERRRMRTPARQYIAANDYPLVDMKMTRQDCLQWMSNHGYPLPPRSACVYCPYRCDLEWRRLRDQDPDGWVEACRVDAMCRASLPGCLGRWGYAASECYVHRSCVPLPDVDLSTDVERGQLLLPGAGWADCEGMCGL